jgi:glycosyltransferase involved in cell wall biosynthesis
MNIFMPYLDPFPVVHGIAIEIQDQGEALLKRGFGVHVVAPRWNQDDTSPENINGVIYHRWNPDFRWIMKTCVEQGEEAWPDGYLEYETKALQVLSKSNRIDLLHVREPHGVKSALKLKREQGIPVLVSFHTYTPLYYQYLYGRNVSKTAGNRWAEYCLQNVSEIDQIVTISEAIKDDYTRYGFPPDKMTVIYCGIDPNVFKPAQSHFLHNRYKLPNSAEIILAVSRLEPAKGQIELIRALPLIIKSRPNVHAVFLGGRAHYEEVYKQELLVVASQLNIVDRIRFDTLLYTDMPAAYNSSTLVISTSSVYEGFGRPMMEASACGKAVIATKVGAHPEVVEHEKSGILISPDDYHLLAETASGMLNSPARLHSMGECGRQRVLAMFTLEECINKYVSIYQSCIKRES